LLFIKGYPPCRRCSSPCRCCFPATPHVAASATPGSARVAEGRPPRQLAVAARDVLCCTAAPWGMLARVPRVAAPNGPSSPRPGVVAPHGPSSPLMALPCPIVRAREAEIWIGIYGRKERDREGDGCGGVGLDGIGGRGFGCVVWVGCEPRGLAGSSGASVGPRCILYIKCTQVHYIPAAANKPTGPIKAADLHLIGPARHTR
jgi:hypothetical protein